MARPKTKGPTIGVQLYLATDRAVREAARSLRVSPGEWIARVVTTEVANQPPPPTTTSTEDRRDD